MDDLHLALAVFTGRVILGILFFGQAFDKIFMIGLKEVVRIFNQEYEKWGMPHWLVSLAIITTSFIELAAALMLIFGVLKYVAIALLCIDLIIVTAGFSIAKPMWDMKHVFPRLALIIFVLIAPSEWDVFTLDYYLGIPNIFYR